LLIASANVRAGEVTQSSDLEFAAGGCSVGSLAFSALASDLGQDVDAMDSQEAREAFLESTLKMDHENYTPVLKPTWLLSYSSALNEVRKTSEVVKAALAGRDITAENRKRAVNAPWNAGADRFMKVCMFRAGKLAGQGKLLQAKSPKELQAKP
jgi:hypothetical protein